MIKTFLMSKVNEVDDGTPSVCSAFPAVRYFFIVINVADLP